VRGYGTSYTALDVNGILPVTRDQALKFREDLRRMLRTWEELHGLPPSFQTKTEREREQFMERQK